MMTKPKTIGVFAGLLTNEGKVRLQRRIEKDSIIPRKTFEGDYELPGGRVEEKDLGKALTWEVLSKELIREVNEELGIDIKVHPNPPVYLAVFEDLAKGICDWAFMFSVPVGREYWDENSPVKRVIIDVGPYELRGLANRPKGEQLLNGWGKRMCRMVLGALLNSPNPEFRKEAMRYLNEINPQWALEYFNSVYSLLRELRREIGLE